MKGSEKPWKTGRLRNRSVSDGAVHGGAIPRPPDASVLPAVDEDSAELPPPSPGTPTKAWERHYRSFLSGRKSSGKATAATTGGSSKLSDLDVPPPPRLIPKQASGGRRKATQESIKEAQAPKQSTSESNLTTALKADVDSGKLEGSVRGGSFFSNVFRQSHSDKPKRRVKSFTHTDELDGTLRRGAEKAYSPSNRRYHAGSSSLDENLVFGRPLINHQMDDAIMKFSPPPSLLIPAFRKNYSSTNRDGSPTSAIKKAFTEFHNSASTGGDAVSAFLGDDPSYSGNSMAWFQQNHSGIPSIMSHNDLAAAGRIIPRDAITSREDVDITSNVRVLKHVLGVESWSVGRRYLIGPAVLAACPSKVRQKICGLKAPIPVREALNSWRYTFENILLGDCLLGVVRTATSVGTSVQQWSSSTLILRQNYLLEYDQDSDLQGAPRGYAHLEGAVCRIHPLFTDSLELHYYGSPCAKSDPHIVMIRIVKHADQERQLWAACLTRAATLSLDNLYYYDKDNPLGRGTYASVYPGRRRGDEEAEASPQPCNRALKVFDKGLFWRHVVNGKERNDTIVREASVQTTLTVRCGHVKSFLRICGFFETSNHVVLELELLDGRDLFNFISSRNALDEGDAARILRDILETLDVMNRIGLAHRDIKPANVLMCQRGNDGPSVKVGDFGMATFVGVDGQVRGRCGTPGYVAPEIFSAGAFGGYGNKVDIFSAGVTLYVMLCGYEPFYGETDAELVQANKAAQVEFPKEEWSSVPELARDLVKKMMHPDPNQRPDAKEAMQHPWITQHVVVENCCSSNQGTASPDAASPEDTCVLL